MKAILVLASLTLLLAGCSSGNEPSVPEQDAEGRYVIHMTQGNRFSPADASVPAGATVVWVNDGGVHDVTATGGEFRSPRTMPKGSEFEFKVPDDASGKIAYQCDLHMSQGMKGTLHIGDHDSH